MFMVNMYQVPKMKRMTSVSYKPLKTSLELAAEMSANEGALISSQTKQMRQ